MSAETAEKRVPPYAPYALFLRFIKELEELGIPRRIDKSIFPGLSNGASSSLLGALRYLNLIGISGVPSESLVRLVAAQMSPTVLEPIVRSVYAFAFKDRSSLDDQSDLTGVTAEELADLFRNQQVSGGTVQKAVAFFVALAGDARIPISGSLSRRKHPTRREPIRQRRPRTPEVPAPTSAPMAPAEPEAMAKQTPLWAALYELLDTKRMTPKEQSAILTVIHYLKKRSDATKPETVVKV